MMGELLFLIWCHYVGDYPLQGDFLGIYKSKHDYLLFVHCLIWTGAVCSGLWLLGSFAWWKLAFLFIGHFFIDRWKCRHPQNKEIGLTDLLWIDQTLHFVQMLVVWYF